MPVIHNSYNEILESVFGIEYRQLSDLHKDLIKCDIELNDVDDLREYRHSIGRNNLHSYANCLEVQARKDGIQLS